MQNYPKLLKNTAYMLRNDGILLSNKDTHPYILEDFDERIKWNIRELFKTPIENSNFIWFYNNTSSIQLKSFMLDTLKHLAEILISDNIDDSDPYDFIYIDDINDISHLLTYFKITPKSYTGGIDKNSINAFIKEVKYINIQCNQEFLRLRVGDMYKGGTSNTLYARISSVDYNWFQLLWELIYSNKQWLSNITITTDEQAGKPYKIYIIDGETILDYPINEFLLLKGNPVIEKIDPKWHDKLKQKLTIEEALGNYGPYHALNRYEIYKYDYQKRNFVDLDKGK